MMPQRIPPGPAGTSCLTCKLRHKRCDKRQPECERCIKGGYECLGYGHIRGAAAKSRGLRTRRWAPPAEQENHSIRAGEFDSIGGNINGGSTEISSEEAHFETLETAVSPSPNNCPNDDQATLTRDKNILTLTSPRSTKNHRPAPLNHISFGNSYPGPSPHQVFALYTQTPRTPFGEAKVFFQSVTFEDYVIAHGDLMMERSYFKPLQNQTELFRRTTLARLQKSSFSRWVMFMCARVCESFLRGDVSQNQIYNRWIGDVDRALKSALSQDIASHEAQDRLEDRLEVQLLKTMMGNWGSSYQLLRTVAPTFVQMVFSNPGFWSESGDPTSVPLGSIIASSHHILAYFALTDSLSAMAFGLPQQVEYNTIGYTPTNAPVPFEWIHSTPAEFHIILSDINACRDKRPGSRTPEDLEQQLLAWQAQPSYYDESWETWMINAWFAVQESWRLALLSYLYLSVYKRPSDDTQIQLCTQQIIEVTDMVKQPDSLKTSVPFFIQYLIVGICARYDSQRTLARDRLGFVSTTRLWLMRGRDFLPVLEHLWQGAAAEGRSVKWSDYLDSRQAVLPVVL